jgi:hypothetical protein
MKIPALLVVLIASVAVAAPAEAASKKRKKQIHRAPVGEIYSGRHPHEVWYGGDYVGRDPDPHIRSFMIRNPRIYDGTL